MLYAFLNPHSEIRNPQCEDRPNVDPGSPISCRCGPLMWSASTAVKMPVGPISNGIYPRETVCN